MSEETWDRVLGDIFAALDRDAAAEGQLIAIAPQLSDEQILRAWAYLAHDDALRWRARSALAHEALQRVVGRSERDGRGTAAVRQLASTLGVEPGRVYHLAQIHGVIGGDGVGATIVEVLPEMAWYDEALAAPDPAAALSYAADQVTAGRPYSPADLRRDVRKVAAARGGPVRERPPSPQCACAWPGGTGRAGRRRRPWRSIWSISRRSRWRHRGGGQCSPSTGRATSSPTCSRRGEGWYTRGRLSRW